MKMKHSNRVIVWTGNLIVAGALLATFSSGTTLAKEKETAKQKEAAKPKEVAKDPVWEDYTVILERNMFSKNRRAPRSAEDDRPRNVAPPANPESFYILRGITSENGAFRACLQDNKQGGVLWVHVGDEVARGKIKAIPSLDSIEFAMGETAKTIQMGYDLEGGRGKIDVRDVSSWGRSGGGPGGDMMRGPGGMRPNDMGGRIRSGSGFDTRFNQRGGGRDRQMGGMNMNRMQPPASSASSSSSDSTTLSGNDAEILRRLMERRSAELGQAVPASDQNQQQPEQGQQPGDSPQQPGSDQQQSGRGQ